MKRTSIMLEIMAAGVIALPVLGWSAGEVAECSRPVSAKLKIRQLKPDLHVSEVKAAVQDFTGQENHPLLITAERLPLSDGIIPGTILLSNQGKDEALFRVNPELFSLDGSFVLYAAVGGKRIAYEGSRYRRVHGAKAIKGLVDVARIVSIPNGLSILFDEIGDKHANPLPDDFIPKPEDAFSEKIVGPAGRFVPIIRPGEELV